SMGPRRMRLSQIASSRPAVAMTCSPATHTSLRLHTSLWEIQALTVAHQRGPLRHHRWSRIPNDDPHRARCVCFDSDHAFIFANTLLQIFPTLFPLAVITKDGLRYDTQRIRLFLCRKP